MSYRKKILIQEKNILLEKKYINEQAPPPPPPPPQNKGVAQPQVPQGTTQATTPVVTTTTTLKIDKNFYDKLSLCSSVKNPENPVEIKTEFGAVLKDPNGKLPYCKKEE
jgi:hypothetical protein